MPRKAPQPTEAPRRARVPNPGPWPTQGFVTVEHLMAALALRSAQSVYNRIAEGLLPPLVPIGTGRVGLPVDVARQALQDLPAKAAELRERRRRAKVASRRAAEAA